MQKLLRNGLSGGILRSIHIKIDNGILLDLQHFAPVIRFISRIS